MTFDRESNQGEPVAQQQRRWGENDTNQLRQLHAQGMSCHNIAKETGWSKATISNKAAKLGLDFDREGTAKATEAYVIDRRHTRAQIIDQLYERTQHLLNQLNAPRTGGHYRTLVPIAPGRQDSINLDHVPSTDERNIANSISSYLAKAEALEKIDNDGGMIEAKSLLGNIAQAIKDSVQGQPRLNK